MVNFHVEFYKHSLSGINIIDSMILWQNLMYDNTKIVYEKNERNDTNMLVSTN